MFGERKGDHKVCATAGLVFVVGEERVGNGEETNSPNGREGVDRAERGRIRVLGVAGELAGAANGAATIEAR